MQAVILAGGKGKRLYPYSALLPKPLLAVGKYPVLDILIRRLEKCGVRNIILAVGHLGDLIQSYVGDGSRWKVRIRCVKEDRPLGTCGPLANIKGLNSTFLAVNGDTLTDLNFRKLHSFHQRKKADLTIAAYSKKLKISSGVVEYSPEGRLKSFTEKPSLIRDVAMGAYVVNKNLLQHIPVGRLFGFDKFINILLKKDKKIVCYPFDGYWRDMGTLQDYEAVLLESKLINKIITGK